MKELDQLLLDSWDRVARELADKPWALGRRMERVARAVVRRPVRAWCLPLRASDSRIRAHELRNEFSTRRCRKGYDHRVLLRGERVRELCRPVRIAYPGVPVPKDFVQRVERTARVRQKRNDHDRHPVHYCGWDWVCPGRVLATGQRVRCGRVCKKLWLPLPVWTIGDALGERAGSAWQAMPRVESARRSFACARCWGMRFDNMERDLDEPWNRFVTVVSGGLLYGREVDRGAIWPRRAA